MPQRLALIFRLMTSKNPSVRKINITNNFTIPKTVKNLALFGNANNPQSLSLDVYTQFNCNYWVDNEQIINDARVRVEEISERITLFVYQKDDVWDLIKKVKWPDFVKDFIKWMQENNGLPSKTYPFTGSFSDLLEPYTLATSGIKLPFYFGNLYNYDPDGGEQFLEDPNSIYLRWWPTDGEKADGGHFCVYAKTIFQYIEQKI